MKKKLLLLFCIGLFICSNILGCGNIEVKTAKDERGTQIKVGYMANYGSLWAVLNAIELGYMQDENLNVELIEYVDGPAIVTALENGDIDVGYIGQGAHKLCINGKAKIFALSHISNADAVIGAPGISSIEELKGKIVAYVEGTSSEDILKMALKKENMTMNDVIGISLGKKEIVSAMTMEGIEGVAIWSPYSLEILEQLEGTKVLADNLTFSDESVGLGSWITTEFYNEYNKRTLVRFTRALFKAMDHSANEHYEETASYVAEQIGINQEEAYKQRGDAKWLTGNEVVDGVKDGTVYEYYELQRKGFVETDSVFDGPKVDEYVLFDIMLEASTYE